jgi:hypothetical protein
MAMPLMPLMPLLLDERCASALRRCEARRVTARRCRFAAVAVLMPPTRDAADYAEPRHADFRRASARYAAIMLTRRCRRLMFMRREDAATPPLYSSPPRRLLS